MGFFSKKTRKQGSYDFSDEDRQHASEIRKLKAQTNKIRQEREILEQRMELERLKQDMRDLQGVDDTDDNDSSTPDVMLMALLTQVLGAKANSQTLASFGSAVPPPTVQAPSCQEFSDEQIQEYLAQIPKKYIKKLKYMDDENKAALIRGYLKGVGDDTVNRSVAAINAL